MNFTDTLNALPADASTPVAFSIGADWAQGRTVFGGLQTALAVRGLMGLAPDDAPLRALQVTFIAPLPVGEALTLEA
ncbi:MAG: acyl-CoA thioesterase domain-containing protein, partial [Polycyclovorans sp.]